MRPITLICALAATLQLLSSNAVASAGWTWPVRGPVLTPYRNGEDPYAAGQHRGIDIGARVGAPVVAAFSGTVTFAGVVGSSGLTVSERTADSLFDLSYLHLSSASVHRGDLVAAGSAIGAVGVSGRRSAEAPHLHFGVREAGTRAAYRDPLDFLAPPVGDRAPRPLPTAMPVAHPVAPAPARSRARRPLPARAPHTAASAALPRAVLAAQRSIQAPQTAPHHPTRPRAVPEPLRGPSAASASDAIPGASAPGPRPASPPTHGGGINVGWLIACLGLVGAATALARPDGTRKLARRSRTRLTALLHPASREG